ncbi:MAG: type II secretion system F family protein [Clostridiales Family XIII bacterium]|nr:type II secretion system F family protein [Clostridiales Family XIII bacterium]
MKEIFKRRRERAARGAKPGLVSRLADLMPQALTGSAEEMERRLQSAFGNDAFHEWVEAARHRNAMHWLICAVLTLLLLATLAVQLARSGEPLIAVERPPYPSAPLRVNAAVEAEYGDASVKRKVELTVRPKELADDEKRARVEATAQRLPRLILGENESLSAVESDLKLPAFDEETGVAISWASETPEILGDDGVLNRVTGGEGDGFALKARLRLGNIGEEVKIEGALGGGPVSTESVAEDVADVLADTVEALNASSEGDALTLPLADAHGVRYRWEGGARDAHIPELLALAAFGVMLYLRRYGAIDKRIKASRRSMIKDFPEFIDKLLLMLNAGLVVSAAISRIAADYERRRDAKNPRRLYEELAAIRRRVENSNASLSVELNRMAARSGVRELMRFAAVVSDNIDKGSALAEKLKAEGELVWKLRKKDTEEAGRLAETKMILPMTLTLLTLILLTMAPAVLDM